MLAHDAFRDNATRLNRRESSGGRDAELQPLTSAEYYRMKAVDRQSRLRRQRELKMARSAHAYVRGNTAQFYSWLEKGDAKLPKGPPVWICGDCHLGNLGPLADKKGRVAVQIRDLDQTVIGNPAHDLIRLGLSLASAARGSNLSGVTSARLLEQLTAGYCEALKGNFTVAKERAHRPKAIQKLLTRSVRRRWKHLALERLEDVKPTIPLGKRFWALKAVERRALQRLFAKAEVRQLITTLQGRSEDAHVAMIDAAYWVKGCSSLGRLRFAVLIRVGEAKTAQFCLIDVKESVVASAPRTAAVAMPADHAQRVVTGAKALSPNLGGRMIAETLLDRPVIVRELMPQDLKLDIEQFTSREAIELAGYLGGVIGRAHGRQMGEKARDGWIATLSDKRTGALDAPSWLWSCVVELSALHEASYLEHCRRYALRSA